MSRKTYWLTKYALSDRIQACDGEVSWTSDDGKHQHVRLDGYASYNTFQLGTHVFEHEADAKAAARTARDRKIASLKKQIAKLEAMKF